LQADETGGEEFFGEIPGPIRAIGARDDSPGPVASSQQLEDGTMPLAVRGE